VNFGWSLVRQIRDISRTGIYVLVSAGIGSEQIRLARHYATGKFFPSSIDQTHLDAAIDWLCQAQDACGGEGVSAWYGLKTGWHSAYPETSGYIIPTLNSYASTYGFDHLYDRARRIGDWEIATQSGNGGVISSMSTSETRVFNTGQVILGWCDLYERSQQSKYLDAAIRGGQYLVRLQEKDGTWKRDTHCGARTYHARVDWALLRLARLTGNDEFRSAAGRNLQWVVAQQLANGWFANCGFYNDDPITHVIGYTLRGLLECYSLDDSVSKTDILERIVCTIGSMTERTNASVLAGEEELMPASFDKDWKPTAKYSCLTGNAQVACVIYRLAQHDISQSHIDTADALLRTLKRTQYVGQVSAMLSGAIAGSYPIYGHYAGYSFPNWAAKFFADAIMLKNNWQHGFCLKG